MSHLILRLGHRGDGIAEGPVYVPRTLPGEVVDGAVEAGRIAAPKILTPSPERVSPPCPHYRSCGGCALLHASDAFVARWKREVVVEALAAQGLDAPVREHVATSPPGTRRRATFAGRRLRRVALVGFHGRASDALTAVPNCLVAHPGILAALPALEALTALAGSRRGELRLTVTHSEAGPDVAAEGAAEPDATARAAMAALAEAHALARLSWNGETVAQRHPPVQRFGGVAVVPPPGAFLQATADGEAALRAAVSEAVGPARRIADLFAGCGTFALPLARGAEVLAVEGAAELTDALAAAWRAAEGLKRIEAVTRDLFRRPLMADELRGVDAVVIDPPRAGAEAQARALAASDVPRIAAVSCNPASFARDAKILHAGGYRLQWVQVVDQFRWSTHVELAALFLRDHMAGHTG